MEQVISFENLEVAPYKIEKLLDVRFEHQINAHSTFYFKGLLTDDKKDSYVKNSGQGSSVSLMLKGAGEKNDILFQGVVRNIEVKSIQGSYYIEVCAVSYSYLLDVEKKVVLFRIRKCFIENLYSR